MSGVSVIIGDPAQPYGVLAVHALKPRRFSQYDVAFLQGVAHVLGAAVERSRTDAAIRASEERFRLLFENSLDAILLTAPDGRVLAANPAACRVFGRSLDDICRAGRAGLIDDSDLWLKPLIEARRQTGCAQGELTFIRGDGTRFPGFCSGSVFHDFQGQARCCLSVRDLTDMKRAEASVADQLAELRRWHDATLGRERRVLELKQEVNELLAAAGQPPRYDSAPDGDGGGEPGR